MHQNAVTSDDEANCNEFHRMQKLKISRLDDVEVAEIAWKREGFQVVMNC